MRKRIGVIGLGNVGESFIRMFKKSAFLVEKRTSLKIELTKVCDIDRKKKSLASRFSLLFTSSPEEIISDPEIDIVVELIGGINPAKKYIAESLKRKKDVVTANKALLSRCGKEIFSQAEKYKCGVGFEASVCGAIPLIKSISEGLVGCEVNRMYGILNGTTNYILYQMHKERQDFISSLRQAQTHGLAERNPALDIEGKDTLHKLCILSYLCFGIWPELEKVYVEGISKISLWDILYAQELNYMIKLLAIAKKEKGFLDLRVHPTFIPQEHPLSQVSSSFNAVFLQTTPAGELLFYGRGAGGIPTSSAIISDIVNVSVRKPGSFSSSRKIPLKNIDDLILRYYIRFMAQDKPGVLAKISKILASYSISIASVTQKERGKKKFVPIVMITHEAKEKNLRRAISRIDTLPIIKPPSQLIRIENL